MAIKPGAAVKTKKQCCNEGPRCARCPVVWKRLAKAGYAQRSGKRQYVVIELVPKRALKKARAKARVKS